MSLLINALVLLSIVTLAMGHSCTCSSSVVVMTKEDLAQEIQSQLATTKAPTSALTSGSGSGSGCVINTTKVTDELYKRIVKLDKEELSDLQEALNCPSNTYYASCREILEHDNASPSGYYWLLSSDVSAEKVYCDMDIICGNVRGWMRIAKLDITDSDDNCPDGFYQAEHNNRSLCAATSPHPGCVGSETYSTRGIQYNDICGKIIAYQQGYTDGIHYTYSGVNGNYLDGISLTHRPPNSNIRRTHIWSFIAAVDENGQNGQCPCTNRNSNRARAPARDVGLNYFCDTGVKEYKEYYDDIRVFTDNPLWDGAGCGPTNDCCTFNTPPWFYRHLHYSTTDDIEMRLCRNSGPLTENILIEKIDLFIR